MEIIVMQRLHRKDLTGYTLDLGDYFHLKLPHVAPVSVIVDFPITGKKVEREKGDLLHPEFCDQAALNERRILLGKYGFAAQEQQDPVAIGGNRIDMNWFRKHDVEIKPDGDFQYDEVVQSIDTGAKDKAMNDPTVIMTAVRKDTRWYLAEVYRKQMAYPELKRALLSREAKWNPSAILIEDKSNGIALIQEGRELGINTIIAIEPEGDKKMRMETEMPQLENGILSLPNPEKMRVPWMPDFEDEIMEFPLCLTFDQIDTLSQLLMWIRKRSFKLEIW
jgi:predicted phage terminase large subunit-like protein